MPIIGTGDDAPKGKPIESPELRDELTEVGVILNLTTQRPIRATASGQAVPPPLNRAKLRGYLAKSTVAVGLAIGLLSLRRPDAPYVPDALLGEWITNNPRYEGRQLAFTETLLELGLVEDARRLRYPTTRLSTNTLADTTVIALTYDADGSSVELHARLISLGPPNSCSIGPTTSSGNVVDTRAHPRIPRLHDSSARVECSLTNDDHRESRQRS